MFDGDRLFMIVSLFQVLNSSVLAPKLFESSMNAHAGFGTLWERGSLKDGPL